MHPDKRDHPKIKAGLHPRNLHLERYDFEVLTGCWPELSNFVTKNKFGDLSIDFFDPKAVKTLNRSLLKYFYGMDYWDIPDGYLCPPVPGRADYLHHLADLLASCNNGKIPVGSQVRCLDIGVGANCIYPILGNRVYGWSFVGSDIDPAAIQNAGKLVDENPVLTNGGIELRIQPNREDIFNHLVQPGEYFDLVLCNPPFHASPSAAQSGSVRKIVHLKQKKIGSPVLNFGGTANELWCPGGEERFIGKMIAESSQWRRSVGWFTVLVAMSKHLPGIYHALKMADATEVRTIGMSQGHKSSRIVAWRYSVSR